MSATQNGTTSESTPELTELADCIEHVDEPRDTRRCPHDCDGILSVDETTDERLVVCNECQCTPDGRYVEPRERTWIIEARGTLFGRVRPLGSEYTKWPPEERERYRGSNEARLGGAYQTCLFDADDKERPDGVTDEYTFDLPLLTE